MASDGAGAHSSGEAIGGAADEMEPGAIGWLLNSLPVVGKATLKAFSGTHGDFTCPDVAR